MTSHHPFERWFRRIEALGVDPSDGEELRLRKARLASASLLFIPPPILWGLIYMHYGERLAGLIPMGYSLVSLVSLAVFARTRHFGFFRTSQLTLILVLPFALMVALGGFVHSSAVILWALICPLGALIFDEPRRAPRWFLGYGALVLVSLFLEPYERASNNLPAPLVELFFALNIAVVSGIVFRLLYAFVQERDAALALLRLEQAKSEGLLLNILPREIAAILKNERRTIAEHFEAASILFADMVGFTPLTAQMPPGETVELLNDVFSHFDTLVEKYGVEKIRTIGDSYMVASGVPRTRPDHAQALARMALDMQDYIRRDPKCAGRQLDFRIGIHSGPVVAGVIGTRKFTYDLWGDTVNTASRMESHGLPGKIQISQETYALLKDEFVCQRRGLVMVKGKGEMETWILTGPRSL